MEIRLVGQLAPGGRAMRWLMKNVLAKGRDAIWPFYLLLVQYHRAGVQASGITITVLAGAYSIAIPILYPALTQGLTPDRFLEILLLLIVVSYGLIVVSGGIALRTADPETNARILLAGRPAKEVLFTISKRIDRSCRRTLKYSTWAEDLLKRLSPEAVGPESDSKAYTLPIEPWRCRQRDRFIRWISLRVFRLLGKSSSYEDPDPVRDEIDCLLWWLRRFPRRQHTALLRIEVMKYRASEELDIPPRRLCDHVFQYSPAMHRDRLFKYIQNWEEILALRQMGRGMEGQRLQDKVSLNRLFIQNTRRRRRYQSQILENRDLLSYIVQFASMHSTSGSLQTYADALSYVAGVGEKRLERTRGGRALKREEEKVETRFAFLCRKQRAHPGFDLHALILRALAHMKDSSLGGAKDLLWDLRHPPLAQERAREALPLTLKGRLHSFRYLPFHFANLVTASRVKISERFDQLYDLCFDDVTKAHYIVSHGYSRTVLSVLKQGLSQQKSRRQPHLFFILPDPKENFDARVMEYELKEDWSPSLFTPAAGTEDHLLGLVEKYGSVLVLLGAECFDKELRMVHPRGVGNSLRKLLRKIKNLRKSHCLVVVVAESYKLHETSLTEDPSFFGQHFDRIDLYPPDLIDLVITDKGIYSLRRSDLANALVSKQSQSSG